MCTCISNGIMAYQYFSSKLMGWNKKLRKTFIFFKFFCEFDSPTSPGAKMGTWKCLRVQGFMIDPESIGVLKEIKLGCHDGNLGELFLFA